MFSVKRASAYPYGPSRIAAAGAVICVGIVTAACSADFRRLDAQSRGLGLSETASVPTPSQPLGRSGSSVDDLPASPPRDPAPTRRWSDDQRAPRGGDQRGIVSSGLPEPAPNRVARLEPSAAPRGEPLPPAQGTPQPYQPRPSVGAPTAQPAIAKGGEIEVVKGDTLYALARRHGVSMAELMSANSLKNTDLKPGQRLVLPGSDKGARVSAPSPGPAPLDRLPVKRAAPKATVPYAPSEAAAKPVAIAPVLPSAAFADVAATEWSGSYEMKAGDSLYVVARRHHVKLQDLQAANKITDPRKVRPGVVLKVPGPAGHSPSGPASTVAGRASATVPPAAPIETRKPAEATLDPTSPRPTIINRGDAPRETAPPAEKASDVRPLDGTPRRVAALNPSGTRTDVPVAAKEPEAGAPAKIGKLRWPVKGKVVANFGPRPDGSHNDGINLSVPAGTEVYAAEAGEVVYSGNELKSYGNLVLIRHANGWVTAYGHNETLLVTRGDKVKRGQPIAKVGKSGSAEQPQLHFEIREDSKPIDPLPHLERS